MKVLASIAAVAPIASLSAPAFAQFQKPEDAVKYRKAALRVKGTHFGRIGAMANRKVLFDAEAVAKSASIVETMSALPWEAFVAETDKGETRAKPEIWTETAKFKEGAEKLQAETAKLSTAAKTGSLDAVKTAFGAVGQSCKACHDTYRKD